MKGYKMQCICNVRNGGIGLMMKVDLVIDGLFVHFVSATFMQYYYRLCKTVEY